MTTTMMLDTARTEGPNVDELFPGGGAPAIRRLMGAEPMAGIVTLKFLRNLMDLNPALRRPVELGGLEELELWEALWTSVYAMPFDAMLTAGSTNGGLESSALASLETAQGHDDEAPRGGSVIGEALLWTLESCFREDFTPSARAAWEALYQFVKESR
jgi:hypothetical protein